MTRRAIFYVDGNEVLGMGHIIRCLAMAGELVKRKSFREIAFLTRSKLGYRVLKAKGHQVSLVPATGLSNLVYGEDRSAVIITDFLDTDENDLEELRSMFEGPILCIDNNVELKEIAADIVVNANVFNQEKKLTLSGVQYFLGIDYMVLRDVFTNPFVSENRITETPSVLIIFGGADIRGLTKKVVKSLLGGNENLFIKVILGPGAKETEKTLKRLTHGKLSVSIEVDPDNLLEIMAKSAAAVSAAGITLYELCRLEVPTLVIPQAPHEKNIAEFVSKKGACINLGTRPDMSKLPMLISTLLCNYRKKEDMKERCRSLIDGKGLFRVVNLVEGLARR